MINAIEQRVLEQIDTLQGDMIRFLQKLIQIPTINPPGEAYDSCARFIGDMLVELGFNTEYIVADDHPDHSSLYPRVNVLGRIPGSKSKPALHFNGHTDVVPAGDDGHLIPSVVSYGMGAYMVVVLVI